MLSLVGSIQPDPFSPEHILDHSIISTTVVSSKHQRTMQREPVVEDVAMTDGEVGDDTENSEGEAEDTFTKLGRMQDEAVAMVKTTKEKGKEKKRKRKEDKTKGEKTAEDDVNEQKKKKKKRTA